MLLAISGGSGCVALDPSVRFNTTGSAVFESASVSGLWATGQVTTNVTLTSSATSEVTQLNVIDSNGNTFDTTTLDSGESSTTVLLPPNGTATIVAVNTINGTTIESRNATVTSTSVV